MVFARGTRSCRQKLMKEYFNIFFLVWTADEVLLNDYYKARPQAMHSGCNSSSNKLNDRPMFQLLASKNDESAQYRKKESRETTRM